MVSYKSILTDEYIEKQNNQINLNMVIDFFKLFSENELTVGLKSLIVLISSLIVTRQFAELDTYEYNSCTNCMYDKRCPGEPTDTFANI